MKLLQHPKAGQEIKLGFILNKIIVKLDSRFGTKNYFLCVEKQDEKRIISYNPKTKEIGSSFERYFSSFGGSSKGSFKNWN